MVMGIVMVIGGGREVLEQPHYHERYYGYGHLNMLLRLDMHDSTLWDEAGGHFGCYSFQTKSRCLCARAAWAGLLASTISRSSRTWRLRTMQTEHGRKKQAVVPIEGLHWDLLSESRVSTSRGYPSVQKTSKYGTWRHAYQDVQAIIFPTPHAICSCFVNVHILIVTVPSVLPQISLPSIPDEMPPAVLSFP